MTDILKTKDYTVSGTFKTTCGIKPYKGSDESKIINLDIVLAKVPLADVITKALRPVVITWQNGPGRAKFTTWTDRQTLTVDFTSPAKKVKSREELIEEYTSTFMKAGLDKESATELATKAVDDPTVIE